MIQTEEIIIVEMVHNDPNMIQAQEMISPRSYKTIRTESKHNEVSVDWYLSLQHLYWTPEDYENLALRTQDAQQVKQALISVAENRRSSFSAEQHRAHMANSNCWAPW